MRYAIGVALSLLAPAGTLARPPAPKLFQTPSSKIICWNLHPTYMQCVIFLDRGGRYLGTVSDSGPPVLQRHPATANIPGVPTYTLKYGHTWHRGAFTCISRTNGLRCASRSGGIFLSQQHSYVFR